MHTREVSPKFLGLNVAKSDIFGSEITEIIAMVLYGIQRGQFDASGLCRGKASFYLHCFRILMFVGRYLSIKLGNVIYLGCREVHMIFFGFPENF